MGVPACLTFRSILLVIIFIFLAFCFGFSATATLCANYSPDVSMLNFFVVSYVFEKKLAALGFACD